MPIAASPSTSRRLLALLSLLQARRDWPAPILAERLEVSERTVRRDIERLRELDYVIDSTRGPDGGYRLGAGSRLPPLLFDDEQVVALTLALRTAGTLGAGVEEAAERALGTVLRMLPERLAQRVGSLAAVVDAAAHATATATRDPSHPAPGGPDGRDGGPAERDGPADPAVLLRIGEAIRSRHELRFDYASPGPRTASERPVRVVEPHHLLFRGGRWYLLGFSPEHEDWRVHRADRIAPRSHDGRRFEPRAVPGGDPARYLAARFRGATAATAGDDARPARTSGPDSWPCSGTAVVHAPVHEIAPYLGDGTAESLGDDRSRVRLGSWSWPGLAAEFCRFPVAIGDAQPADLRAAFAALAARAAAAGH